MIKSEDIGKIVNKFYLNDFPDCKELIIKSSDKGALCVAQKKYYNSTIGNYKVCTEVKTIIGLSEKSYYLHFTFDKIY